MQTQLEKFHCLTFDIMYQIKTSSSLLAWALAKLNVRELHRHANRSIDSQSLSVCKFTSSFYFCFLSFFCLLVRFVLFIFLVLFCCVLAVAQIFTHCEAHAYGQLILEWHGLRISFATHNQNKLCKMCYAAWIKFRTKNNKFFDSYWFFLAMPTKCHSLSTKCTRNARGQTAKLGFLGCCYCVNTPIIKLCQFCVFTFSLVDFRFHFTNFICCLATEKSHQFWERNKTTRFVCCCQW